jgi:hypothetical protein
MPENTRVLAKKIEEGEKGDGKCYFPCKRCCTPRRVRILIGTTKRDCRRYGNIDE